jgi:hypothetical protein
MPDWMAGLLPRRTGHAVPWWLEAVRTRPDDAFGLRVRLRTPADATGEVAAIVLRLCCAPTAPAPDRGRRRRQGGPRDETKRQSRLRLVR